MLFHAPNNSPAPRVVMTIPTPGMHCRHLHEKSAKLSSRCIAGTPLAFHAEHMFDLVRMLDKEGHVCCPALSGPAAASLYVSAQSEAGLNSVGSVRCMGAGNHGRSGVALVSANDPNEPATATMAALLHPSTSCHMVKVYKGKLTISPGWQCCCHASMMERPDQNPTFCLAVKTHCCTAHPVSATACTRL